MKVFPLAFLLIACCLPAKLYAQQRLFFGLSAGAALNLPSDWETSAIKRWVYSGNVSNVDSGSQSYYSFVYEQYDYSALSPSFAFSFGYASPHFSLRTGFDLFVNYNENFLLRRSLSSAASAIVTYKYTSLHLPFMFDYYPIAKEKFKLGFQLGAYVSFPLGDVEKHVNGRDIFDTSYTPPSQDIAYRQPPMVNATKLIAQDMTGGVQFGIIAGLQIAGRGEVVLDIAYKRELFNGVNSMLGSVVTSASGSATIDDAERKLMIMSGIRLLLGYRFSLNLKGRAGGGAGGGAEALTSNSIRYYVMVAGRAEGPLGINDLARLAENGLINAGTLLWKKGMTNWSAAESFEELGPILYNGSGQS
jgi:hypothetical protein